MYFIGVLCRVLTMVRAVSSLWWFGKFFCSWGVMSFSRVSRSMAFVCSYIVLGFVWGVVMPWGVILPMYCPVIFLGYFLLGRRLLVVLYR